jgi:hypothetical protein
MQKKGATEDEKLPIDKGLQVLDSNTAVTRPPNFVCDGKDGKYSGSGETEQIGKDAYRGKMKSSGVRQGEKFDMSMEFSGKRVGTCTWEDPGKQAKAMQAESAAMIAKECDKAIAELEPMMVFGGQGLPPEAIMCKERKADFCANASKVAQKMRDPAGFSEANGKYNNWREAMKACGTDPAGISGPVCKSALDKKDWTFMTSHCSAETAALRKAHCDGRTYDTVEASYKEACSQLGGLSYTAKRPIPPRRKPPRPTSRSPRGTRRRRAPRTSSGRRGKPESSSSSERDVAPSSRGRALRGRLFSGRRRDARVPGDRRGLCGADRGRNGLGPCGRTPAAPGKPDQADDGTAGRRGRPHG